MRLSDAPLRAEHRATRHVGRLTKYNTLTGNTWGVSSPVFTRNHPPGTSRSGERGGRSSLCAQMSQGSKSPFSSERWNVDDLDPMAERFAAERKRFLEQYDPSVLSQ